MSGAWIETTTDEEARALDRGMWEMVAREAQDGGIVAQAPGPALENGEFWADALNRIKDDADQRYAMARRHLPLPAAWREMAVALRAKIRKARKEKANYEDHLRELHHLAAMSSYAGYGHIQRVPYSRLASLDLLYHRVGCDRLELLGVTDRKWMQELWGTPSKHTTAAELYRDMLTADIQRIKADQEQERQEQMEWLIGDLESEDNATTGPLATRSKRRGFWGWLFG